LIAKPKQYPVSFPIPMGKRNTRMDWSKFDARCMETIGRIPDRTESLSRPDLWALGFYHAADGIIDGRRALKAA
jgi:hypothetical protein